MGRSNGIITPSISLPADVSYVLGAASADTGILCRHPNINMWAKHKPVVYPDLEKNGNTGFPWKGINPTKEPYGIVMNVTNGGLNETTIAAMQTPLTYRRPFGGMDSPYRIPDFNGYNHHCVPPFDVELPSGEYPVNQGMIRCRINNINPLPEGNLTLSDIMPADTQEQFGDMFFAVIVYGKNRSNLNEIYIKAIPVSSVSMTLRDCPLWSNNITGRELNVLACMVNKPIPSWSTTADNVDFLSLCYPGITTSSIVKIGGELKNTYVGSITITGVGAHFKVNMQAPTAGYLVANCTITNSGSMEARAEYELTRVVINAYNQETGAQVGSTVTKTSGTPIGSLVITKNNTRFDIQTPASWLPNVNGVICEFNVAYTFTKL